MNTKKIVAITSGVVVVVVLLVINFTLFSAPQSNAEVERFTVSLDEKVTSADLQTAGFVKHSSVLSFALRGHDIQPGAYKISKSMSVWQIASVLRGEPYMKWVVIPEGLRKEEIADILKTQLGWTDAEEKEWVTKDTAPDPLYIEGVYFPDTYLIPTDESPSDVADRLRAKFNEKFAPYLKESQQQDIKWDTLLKIASIIQREAAGKDDMPIISGVIWNRLLKNMKLEIDATIEYARGDTGKGWWAPLAVADKQIDSPYNTYKYAGLPPHPIANPGLEAIAAALHPAATDCLYYLHDSSRTIHCAVTYEEHQANIEKYLK
jgi:UPF0755 protein